MSTELTNYNAARVALANAHKIDEVRTIKNQARALELYAIEAKDTEMELWAVAIRTRAERRAGELLDEMGHNGKRAKRGGDRKSKSAIVDNDNGRPQTLSQLGVTLDESSDWQKLAKILEPDFEQRIEQLVARRQKPSTAEVLRKDHQQRKVVDSSDSDEWYTPPKIVELVVRMLEGVDLDPCSNAAGKAANVPAEHHYCAADDGLALKWRGKVYMNPPYGKPIKHWVAKFVDSFKTGEMTEGIALVAARTETKWFQLLLGQSPPICFITGRLNFSNAPNDATFPSALIYLGKRIRRFAKTFNETGPIYVRWEDK